MSDRNSSWQSSLWLLSLILKGNISVRRNKFGTDKHTMRFAPIMKQSSSKDFILPTLGWSFTHQMTEDSHGFVGVGRVLLCSGVFRRRCHVQLFYVDLILSSLPSVSLSLIITASETTKCSGENRKHITAAHPPENVWVLACGLGGKARQ